METLFEKPVFTLIQARKSVRTFEEHPLSGELLQKIQDVLHAAQDRTLNGAGVRFVLLNKKETAAKAGAKIGTYGVVRGTDCFIAAITPKGDGGAALQLGYQLETAVLQLRALGLGTCWLAGTFNKGEFAKAAGLRETEDLCIVMPVGRPREREGTMQRLMRAVAGSDGRKPFAELFWGLMRRRWRQCVSRLRL